MTTRCKLPNDLLHDLLLAYPKASEKEIFEHFVARIKDSPACDDVILRYWFANHFKKYEVVTPAPHSTAVMLRDSLERNYQDRQSSIASSKSAMIRAMLTMGFVMPNGDELRNCTIGYVGQMGGHFAAMARTATMRGGKSNALIGKHITDADLQKMQGVRKAAA